MVLAALSRLLPPQDFGLLALATVVTSFAGLLRDMGTAAAIIQREHLSARLLDAVFWFNILVGAGLALIVILLAVPIADLFRQTRLAGVLTALAICFPLASIGAVHQSLLERSLRFRSLARIETSSGLLALVIAIVAAIHGLGVYSLVLNTITTAAFTSLQLWFASKWRPKGRWSVNELRAIWKFSANLFGFQTLNYFARNADTMLIGRFLGATDVGWYNMSYRIMLFPLTNLSGVISRVLFPMLSRRQTDTALFGALYLKLTSALAVVIVPLMIELWVLRKPFVDVVLGKRWWPVAEVLAWLAPVGMVQSVFTTVGLIYMATGNTRLMMRWGLFAGVMIVTAMAIGLRWGYLGVAKSYAVVTFLLLYPLLAVPLKLVGLKIIDVIRSVRLQVITATIMAIVLSLLEKTLSVEMEPLLRLIVLMTIGVLTYLATGYFVMRSTLMEVLAAIVPNNKLIGLRQPLNPRNENEK
jgi:PST family polysaccharide transporter